MGRRGTKSTGVCASEMLRSAEEAQRAHAAQAAQAAEDAAEEAAEKARITRRRAAEIRVLDDAGLTASRVHLGILNEGFTCAIDREPWEVPPETAHLAGCVGTVRDMPPRNGVRSVRFEIRCGVAMQRPWGWSETPAGRTCRVWLGPWAEVTS